MIGGVDGDATAPASRPAGIVLAVLRHVLLALVSVITATVGVFAVRGFRWLLARLGDGDGPWTAADRWWVVLPAFGCVLGMLIVRFAKVTPVTVDAYVAGLADGRQQTRAMPPRAGALVAGVGAGAPLGYEGPLIYVGGSIGAVFGRMMSAAERPFVLAGGAATVSAVLGSPLAAALFASEVTRRGMPRRSDAVALAIAATTSWWVLGYNDRPRAIIGDDPGRLGDRAGVFALLLGVTAGFAAAAFVATVRWAKARTWSLGVRLPLVVGALVAGLGSTWWWVGDPVLYGPGERLRDWAVGEGAAEPVWVPVVLVAVFVAMVVACVAGGVVGGLYLPLLALGSIVGLLVRTAVDGVPLSIAMTLGAFGVLAAGYGTRWTAVALLLAAFGWSAATLAGVVVVIVASLVSGSRTVSVGQTSARPSWWPGGRHVHS